MGSFTLRAVGAGMFKLHASTSEAKTWTGKGQVGRFEPIGSSVTVVKGMPEDAIRAYIDAADADARLAVLAPFASSEVTSAFPVTASDLTGWIAFAGGRNAAGALAARGILVLPELNDPLDGIDAMLRLAGFDPLDAAFNADAPVDAPEGTEGTSEGTAPVDAPEGTAPISDDPAPAGKAGKA